MVDTANVRFQKTSNYLSTCYDAWMNVLHNYDLELRTIRRLTPVHNDEINAMLCDFKAKIEQKRQRLDDLFDSVTKQLRSGCGLEDTQPLLIQTSFDDLHKLLRASWSLSSTTSKGMPVDPDESSPDSEQCGDERTLPKHGNQEVPIKESQPHKSIQPITKADLLDFGRQNGTFSKSDKQPADTNSIETINYSLVPNDSCNKSDETVKIRSDQGNKSSIGDGINLIKLLTGDANQAQSEMMSSELENHSSWLEEDGDNMNKPNHFPFATQVGENANEVYFGNRMANFNGSGESHNTPLWNQEFTKVTQLLNQLSKPKRRSPMSFWEIVELVMSRLNLEGYGSVEFAKQIAVESVKLAMHSFDSNSNFGELGTEELVEIVRNHVSKAHELVIRKQAKKAESAIAEISQKVLNEWKYKTMRCTDFTANGRCPRGSDCHFAHGPADQRPEMRMTNFSPNSEGFGKQVKMASASRVGGNNVHGVSAPLAFLDNVESTAVPTESRIDNVRGNVKAVLIEEEEIQSDVKIVDAKNPPNRVQSAKGEFPTEMTWKDIIFFEKQQKSTPFAPFVSLYGL